MLELAMKYGDDWKRIAEEMKLKSKREAILEFLRIPTVELEKNSEFLQNFNAKPLAKVNSLKDIGPYN